MEVKMSDQIEPINEEIAKYIEMGTLGLQSTMGYVEEAYHADLHWPGVQPLYSRMRRSDPEISVIRGVYQALARSVKLKFVLDDDPNDDEKKALEFAESVLDDLEDGQDGFLSTLVAQVPFMGVGWWEGVLGLRKTGWIPPDDDDWRSQYNDGNIGIRRLAWRDHSSFDHWDLDENTGKLRGFIQRQKMGQSINIPLNRSLHITFGDTHNPEGLTPLEAVWRLERIKYGLEVVQGIGFEHSAGYLDVVTDQILSPQDKADIKRNARAIATAQEGNYAIWPKGVKGELVSVPFSAANSILDAIKYFGILKLTIYNMQWVALASISDAGSRAAMSDSSQMFITTYNAMLDGFASQMDNQLIRRLFWLNGDRFPKLQRRPHLVCTHIDKQISLSELANFLDAIAWMDLSEEDVKDIRRHSGILNASVPAEEDVIRPGSTTGTSQPENGTKPEKPVVEPAKPPKTTKTELPRTMQQWATLERARSRDALALELQRANDLIQSRAG